MAVDMYRAKAGSPTTVITGNLTASTDTIPVQDIAALTAAPGLATLLDGQGNQEIILYTGITGNDLTGVTRGFEGDAQSWPTGTFISRRLTAHDVNSAQENIEELQTDKLDATTFNTHASRHETGGADEIDLTDLPGISAELATHKADIATEERHGLRVNSLKELQYFDGIEWLPASYKNLNYYNQGTNGDFWDEGAKTGVGSRSKEINHLHLFTDRAASGGNSLIAYTTSTKVDLSTTNIIKVDWETPNTNEPYAARMLIVGNQKMGTNTEYVARLSQGTRLTSRAIEELDVSALKGSYYIRALAFANSDPSSTLKVYKVWGE